MIFTITVFIAVFIVLFAFSAMRKRFMFVLPGDYVSQSEVDGLIEFATQHFVAPPDSITTDDEYGVYVSALIRDILTRYYGDQTQPLYAVNCVRRVIHNNTTAAKQKISRIRKAQEAKAAATAKAAVAATNKALGVCIRTLMALGFSKEDAQAFACVAFEVEKPSTNPKLPEHGDPFEALVASVLRRAGSIVTESEARADPEKAIGTKGALLTPDFRLAESLVVIQIFSWWSLPRISRVLCIDAKAYAGIVVTDRDASQVALQLQKYSDAGYPAAAVFASGVSDRYASEMSFPTIPFHVLEEHLRGRGS
jgi:hypothetical protein